MSSTGNTILKLALVAGAAYGAYYLYKNYIKKPMTQPTREFEDITSDNFEINHDAVVEETLADKIRAAAERQLEKLK